MTQRKKLIEVALPLEAINQASAREKSIRHGHPSTLHLWWARRPLAAARAVIFASLVDDPDSPDAPPEFVAACKRLPAKNNALVNDTPRMRLFDFIEDLVQWENTTNETILNQARELIRLATNGNPPPLLDPFAGGGSIPLEAQRLGLEAHASDLNPVAVMINKAQIEIPPRFADLPPVNPRERAKIGGVDNWKGASGLAADVRYYGEWMRERAWERIGHLYPTHNGETVIAWIWARTVKSPNPALDVRVPLAKSFELSKKKSESAWVEPVINLQDGSVSFEVKRGEGKSRKGTMDEHGGYCIVSGVPITFDYIRDEAQAGRLGSQLVAIITEGKNGHNFHSPTSEQERIARSEVEHFQPLTDLPERALGFRVQRYGITKHAELFTSRQLSALTVFSDLIREVRNLIYADAVATGIQDDKTPLRQGGKNALAYAEALSVYLAFAVDKGANYWSSLCAWYSSKEIMMSTFSRQALSMTWDFAEANPFSDSSGNFMLGVEQAAKLLEAVPFDAVWGEANQNDASQLRTAQNILISTDPPYYDNIGYAALSDFFYVWLRRSVGEVFPNLFSTLLTPKEQELIAEPARHNSKEEAARFFEQGLFRVFENLWSLVPTSYPTTVFYAFKQSETEADDSETASTGWETFLSGLVNASFNIIGTLPVRTEQTGGVRVVGRNSLASSIVLVCRPRPEDAPTISRRQFVDTLRRELPAALKELQSGNIAPVDLAQASIGPGMAVYSRYKAVLEADGKPLTVRAALGLINQELDAYLAEQDGEIDPDTRFAVAWFEQFAYNEGAFGQADVLARAKNTSVAGVTEAFIAKAAQGKVSLYTPTALYELNAHWNPAQDKRPTVWEATHHLIERVNRHGESAAADLLLKLPDTLASEARALAYRLYNICERKGWAELARDYNALVISWTQIQALAAEKRDQTRGSEQLGLL